jgi:hypothetical protein
VKKKGLFIYTKRTVTKTNKVNKEAATIRTNFPMRPQCGVYYYEIRVISKGTDGLFAIGFCTDQSKLNTLPGTVQYSILFYSILFYSIIILIMYYRI